MKRSLVLAAALSCTLVGMDASPPPRRLLFGSDLAANCPEAARELFFACGLNCVRITGGGFGWAEGKHSAWATQLATRHVPVYLQLGSHYPPKSYFGMPGAMFVDQHGETGVEDHTANAIRYGGSTWPQYSYADPGFRDKLAIDFAHYLAKFPPGGDLVGVILHNEPGYLWDKDRILDYSPLMVARFRAWLPTQHLDIAALNQRWGTQFTSFSDVVPPLKPAADQVAGWMDWRRFQVVQIADFMTWEAALVKKLRPDLMRTTNLDGATNNWYALRCSDIEAYSRSMDTVGIDIYPARWTDRAFVPFSADQLQGVAQGRRTDVLECEVYGDQAKDWKDLSSEQRADLLRSELWTLYGHGVDGVLLWGFSKHNTFTITDGEWNPRVQTCRDLAAQQRVLGLERFHRADSMIAICVDPDVYIRTSALDGGGFTRGDTLDRDLHAMHAALSAAGAQCDVIFKAQLPNVLKRYRTLILPVAPIMDQATADLLRTFVADGGMLIATAPFATCDRWGSPLPQAPAFGLASLFTGTKEALPTGPLGATLMRSGRGWVALFANPVGQYLRDELAELPGLIEHLLTQAGRQPAVGIACSGAIRPDVSSLRSGSDQILVVAAQSGYGKTNVPCEDVRLTLRGLKPTAAFAFPATAVDAGLVRSGPQVVPQEQVAGDCVLRLGTVRSSLPVLLTFGRGPLLALCAPARCVAGKEAIVGVTCYNPSNSPVSGTIEMPMPLTGMRMPVQIPPWSSTPVRLPLTPQASTKRLEITVTLTTTNGTVSAIPLDITVE